MNRAARIGFNLLSVKSACRLDRSRRDCCQLVWGSLVYAPGAGIDHKATFRKAQSTRRPIPATAVSRASCPSRCTSAGLRASNSNQTSAKHQLSFTPVANRVCQAAASATSSRHSIDARPAFLPTVVLPSAASERVACDRRRNLQKVCSVWAA